jgi:hypothetical protein
MYQPGIAMHSQLRPGEVLRFSLPVLGAHTQSIPKQYALSPEAAGCISLEEANMVVDRVNLVLQTAPNPVSVDGLLFFFVCPCWSMVNMMQQASDYQSNLQAVVHQLNQNTVALGNHYHWYTRIFWSSFSPC